MSNFKLGLFYQTVFRYIAAYNALKQFRKFYPDGPVAMYEDNSFVMEPIAKLYKCTYSRTSLNGFNDPNSGRPAFNLKTILGWYARVYEACTTVLSEVDYIMNFEDDVWFIRSIQKEPKYDLSGISGVGWNIELYDYLQTDVRSIYGCGGSVFNRLKFIQAYEQLEKIDWNKIAKYDTRPLEWTDSALTLLFLNAKMSVGTWEDAQQYRHLNIPHMHNREGWPGSMQELENQQQNVAVVHCWKPYYYPTEQEVLEVNNQLLPYV